MFTTVADFPHACCNYDFRYLHCTRLAFNLDHKMLTLARPYTLIYVEIIQSLTAKLVTKVNIISFLLL